jgi:predicted nucleic acid-binding protein
VKALLDTNVLVDYLRGAPEARGELARYAPPAVSLVTWMEILVGAGNSEEEGQLRRFLTRFELHPISVAIAERALAIRRVGQSATA